MTEANKRTSSAIIKVIGVGGGGGNAINTMIESGLEGVEFIAANTDIQALQSNRAALKIQLGRELTKGLGAGANPGVGHDAALEDKAIIQEVIGEADMVFVTAGMGGGTGTGAAPVIAQVAREMGALTVGVVTKPFIFEGKKRRNFADQGIQRLRASVDTLITIPNQRLLALAQPSMSMLDGFRLADDVLLNAVKGISEIINIPGRINVDFADVKTVMSEMGMALMGTGVASGANRATEAAQAAISSPLLEDVDIEGATGLLINITGPETMSLHEISVASSLIQEAAHEDANIILGAAIDPSLGDELRVTVIATGFDQAHVAPPERTGVQAMQTAARGAPAVSFPTARSAATERVYAPNQTTSGLHARDRHPVADGGGGGAGPGLDRYEAEQLMRLTLEMAGGDESPQTGASFAAPAASQGPQHADWTGNNAPQSHAQPGTGAAEAWGSGELGSRLGASARPDLKTTSHQPGTFAENQGTGFSEAGAPSQNNAQASVQQAGPGTFAPAGAEVDPLTERALRIAQEFSDDDELERPAFLRRRDSDRPMG